MRPSSLHCHFLTWSFPARTRVLMFETASFWRSSCLLKSNTTAAVTVHVHRAYLHIIWTFGCGLIRISLTMQRIATIKVFVTCQCFREEPVAILVFVSPLSGVLRFARFDSHTAPSLNFVLRRGSGSRFPLTGNGAENLFATRDARPGLNLESK